MPLVLPYKAGRTQGYAVRLRSYQSRALVELRAAYKTGHRRILLVSPTGSGKAVMAAAIAASYFARNEADARGVLVAHRRELVVQGAAKLEAMGVPTGHSGAGASLPMQAIMAQTALARGELPPAWLRLFDECHHYVAPEWQTLLDTYADLDGMTVGFTATPERGDGKALDWFTKLIEVTTTRELVDLWIATDGREGLVPVETYRPAAPERAGHLAKSPAEAYVMHGLRGKRNVVFAASVPDAERFSGEFRAMGIGCHTMHADLDTETRDRYLADFHSGRVNVLTNVYILTEGWDCPALDVVTIARRCGSVSMLLQMVGRGRRPADGKVICTILDLAGVTHIHGDVDEERILSLEGVGISRKVAATVSYCRVCGNILEPGEGCCACGRPRDEVQPIAISGNRLDKFARYHSDDERSRSVRLARWIDDEIAKGRVEFNAKLGVNVPKWKTAMFRYKAVYGRMPPPRIISQAASIRGGWSWCNQCGHGKSCKCKQKESAA